MDAMTPREVVQTYWERVQARDWSGVRKLLYDAIVVDWPASRERIGGADNVVAVNREYPEGWSIRVLDVLADGERVASEVEVPQEGVGTFRVASFWTVRDGRILRGTEYWIEIGQDDVPAWRRPYTEPLPGEPAEP